MTKCDHILGMCNSVPIRLGNKKEIIIKFNKDVEYFNTTKKAVPHPGYLIWCNYCPECGEKNG